MDLPDYDSAADATEFLLAGHQGQHRCSDGRYYTPSDWRHCPTSVAVHALTGTLLAVQALPHAAAHNAEHVDLVLYGMTGLVAADLQPEDRDAWRLTTRQALETNAALLDPTVPAAPDPLGAPA